MIPTERASPGSKLRLFPQCKISCCPFLFSGASLAPEYDHPKHKWHQFPGHQLSKWESCTLQVEDSSTAQRSVKFTLLGIYIAVIRDEASEKRNTYYKESDPAPVVSRHAGFNNRNKKWLQESQAKTRRFVAWDGSFCPLVMSSEDEDQDHLFVHLSRDAAGYFLQVKSMWKYRTTKKKTSASWGKRQLSMSQNIINTWVRTTLQGQVAQATRTSYSSSQAALIKHLNCFLVSHGRRLVSHGQQATGWQPVSTGRKPCPDVNARKIDESHSLYVDITRDTKWAILAMKNANKHQPRIWHQPRNRCHL